MAFILTSSTLTQLIPTQLFNARDRIPLKQARSYHKHNLLVGDIVPGYQSFSPFSSIYQLLNTNISSSLPPSPPSPHLPRSPSQSGLILRSW
ncbi:MAG TPA: hypothetical protein VK211_23895 [Kamptonema sp.]|nr:hypothetical protein [Kamptonema sp.]